MNKLRLAAFVLAALLLTAACGGKDSDEGGGQGSGGVGSALTLQDTLDKVQQLESFRFDMTLKLDAGPLPTAVPGMSSADLAAIAGMFSNVKMEGAFKGPDSAEVKMTLGGREARFVQVGTRAWVNYGGSWQETEAEQINLSSAMTDPVGGPIDLAKAKKSLESVNGVKATRYSWDLKALAEKDPQILQDPEARAALGDLTRAKLDLWLTEEAVPTRILFEAEGKDDAGQKVTIYMETNLRDINSKSINIRPPS